MSSPIFLKHTLNKISAENTEKPINYITQPAFGPHKQIEHE